VTVELVVDGERVEVVDDGSSLLDALRERLGRRSVKDGCSPQGQCGCCTVLVDGQPRVACVTPVRRVAGRTITTLDGLAPAERDALVDAFVATGASQCGFCTPGIIVRLAALRAKGTPADDLPAVERALAGHLCRCTGWRTILDAWATVDGPEGRAPDAAGRAPDAAGRALDAAGRALDAAGRSFDAAGRRATIEGRSPQRVGPDVVRGDGGFADDTAPAGALVALPDGAGGWVVGETLADARARSGKVQGRRTSRLATAPLEVPAGDWVRTLRTGWVEPAYLEPDASWCEPGGQPASPLANGGAFGAKSGSEVALVARRLADEHGRPVRALLPREEVVRRGPKRPPLAAGVRADGTGVVRVVRTAGIADRIRAVAPGLLVEEVDVPGPPTSAAIRAAGWAEAVALLAAADGGAAPVVSPDGAHAEAGVTADGGLSVRVSCGDPLDEVVLRSYCVGAAHMALSWVTSEALSVDDGGEVHDLTVRSFGVVRAGGTPPVYVTIDAADGPPVNGSDAVFAAVAAAVWAAQGFPPEWPTGLGVPSSGS
jgi:xanthine dehydrogenase small subunit